MATVTYRAPDILHWFETGSQEALRNALKRGRAMTKGASEASVKQNIIRAAGVAAELGKGAVADLVHKQSEQAVYRLYEDKFTVTGAFGPLPVPYSSVVSIKAHGKDKFTIKHSGGTITIKPVAQLSSGTVRVPVGWSRNDIEVPYTMLLEELSARCALEIEHA